MSTSASPLPLPAAPYDVACHAGQAARAEMNAAKAVANEDLRRGRAILAVVSLADMGDVADDLRCAILAALSDAEKPADVWSLFVAEQDDNWADLAHIDTAALEDAAAILRNTGRR